MTIKTGRLEKIKERLSSLRKDLQDNKNKIGKIKKKEEEMDKIFNSYDENIIEAEKMLNEFEDLLDKLDEDIVIIKPEEENRFLKKIKSKITSIPKYFK